MSNLYYGYRPDGPSQRAPPAHAPKDALHGHAHAQPLPFAVGVPPVRGAPPASAASALPYTPQHAWSLDPSPSHPTAAVSTAQPSLQPSPFPRSTATSFAVSQAASTAARNVVQLPPTSQARALFDDVASLHVLHGKPFADVRQPTSSSLPLSSPHQHHIAPLPQTSQPTDPFASLRSNTGTNVFDPSEFPSLAGALSAQQAMQVPTSAHSALLQSSASPPDNPNASSLAAMSIQPQPTVNGMSPYHDLFNVGAYADRRTKAVDALTGTSGTAEFSMHSEDFPALGGPSASPSSRGSASQQAQPHHLSLAQSSQQAHSVSQSASHLANSSLLNASQLQDEIVSSATDAFFDRTSSQATSQQQQSHSLLARTHNRDIPVHLTRTHVPNGFPGADLQTELARQSTSTQLDPNSPPKPFPPVSMSSASHVPGGVMDGFLGDDPRQRTHTAAAVNGDIMHRGALPAIGRPEQMGKASSATLLSRLAGASQAALPKSGSPSVSEKYGMKALLPIVLPLAEGSSDNILSVGLDLTALGLNLNSPEPLHKTFENPWEGGQGVTAGGDPALVSPKSKEPEYKLPTCYYMQPPSLRSSHFTKFQLETLFYIFYNMPRDVLQLLAAAELYNRKWQYHKDLKLWFTRDGEILAGYDRGGYIYFDIKSWERRPFQDANPAFVQGLMTEDELNSVKIPPL